MERIRQCDYFSPIHHQLDELLNANTFIGRAPSQVGSVGDFLPAMSDLFVRGWLAGWFILTNHRQLFKECVVDTDTAVLDPVISQS